MHSEPSKAAMERAHELCDHCDRHCPAEGDWHCPICDAEWRDVSALAAGYTITKEPTP